MEEYHQKILSHSLSAPSAEFDRLLSDLPTLKYPDTDKGRMMAHEILDFCVSWVTKESIHLIDVQTFFDLTHILATGGSLRMKLILLLLVYYFQQEDKDKLEQTKRFYFSIDYRDIFGIPEKISYVFQKFGYCPQLLGWLKVEDPLIYQDYLLYEKSKEEPKYSYGTHKFY